MSERERVPIVKRDPVCAYCDAPIVGLCHRVQMAGTGAAAWFHGAGACDDVARGAQLPPADGSLYRRHVIEALDYHLERAGTAMEGWAHVALAREIAKRAMSEAGDA